MGRDINPIAVFGFPRSGNTFVRSVIELTYPQFTFKSSRHSLKQLEHEVNTTNIVVVFRNPLDSIGSWSLYREETKDTLMGNRWRASDSFEKDIAYYLRFYDGVLKYKDSITLLDFDLFSNDIGYIQDRISKFNIGESSQTDIDAVKAFMMESGRHINLPRDTKDVIKERQKYLVQEMLYDNAVQLHEKLKMESVN